MQIELWKNFSKRRNSTKTPADAGTTYEIYLKEDTDTDNPIIVLEPVDLGFTYARFLGHYYFVSQEVILTNNMMQLSLEMDPLASNKSSIGSDIEFIAYSSTGYDANIVDPRLSSKVTKTITTAENDPSVFDKDGCYIMSIANNIGSETTFACQYVILPSQLVYVAQLLMNTDTADAIIQFFEGKPSDSIISLLWIPIKSNLITGSSFVTNTTLRFADYTPNPNLRFPSFVGSSTVLTSAGLINIPWTYNDFRRNQPYTTMSLFIPCYGLIDINCSDFIGESHIKYEFKIDVSTGDVSLIISRNSDSVIINTINYNIGVACPIAQTSVNAGGVLSGTGGVIGGLGTAAMGLMTENMVMALGGAAATVVSAGNALMSSNQRSVSTRGSIQGRSSTEMGKTLKLQVFSQNTENPNSTSYIAKQGRPVMHYDTIGNHSGYIQCSNASFSGSVISSERDAINSFLNGGFYYE